MNTAFETKGVIFDIQRFCLHDGPGIRTTIFFKGCHLSCAWCHNPESWKCEPELFYHSSSCIGCGKCSLKCTEKAHEIIDGIHHFARLKCNTCFACTDVCPTNSLEKSGKSITVSEVVEAVLRDLPFYNGNGGVTISGGEPFMQSEFLFSLLKALKKKSLHVCIETSGAGKLEDMLAAKEYADIFLYDCKLIPGEKHKQYTGADGKKMHYNLKELDKSGAKTILRCPIIPGVNDNFEYFEYVSALADSLENLLEINVQPYHPTGLAKANDIGNYNMFSIENYSKNEFKEKIKNTFIPIISKGRVKAVLI